MAEEKYKPTLLLLSKRLRYLVHLLNWLSSSETPEENRAEVALNQITNLLDKVKLTQETALALSHPLIEETLIKLVGLRERISRTQRGIKWDMRPDRPYDGDDMAIKRVHSNCRDALRLCSGDFEKFAAKFEVSYTLYHSKKDGGKEPSLEGEKKVVAGQETEPCTNRLDRFTDSDREL